MPFAATLITSNGKVQVEVILNDNGVVIIRVMDENEKLLRRRELTPGKKWND